MKWSKTPSNVGLMLRVTLGNAKHPIAFKRKFGVAEFAWEDGHLAHKMRASRPAGTGLGQPIASAAGVSDVDGIGQSRSITVSDAAMLARAWMIAMQTKITTFW